MERELGLELGGAREAARAPRRARFCATQARAACAAATSADSVAAREQDLRARRRRRRRSARPRGRASSRSGARGRDRRGAPRRDRADRDRGSTRVEASRGRRGRHRSCDGRRPRRCRARARARYEATLIAIGDEVRDQRRVIAVAGRRVLVHAFVDRAVRGDEHGPAAPAALAADLAARDDDERVASASTSTATCVGRGARAHDRVAARRHRARSSAIRSRISAVEIEARAQLDGEVVRGAGATPRP